MNLLKRHSKPGKYGKYIRNELRRSSLQAALYEGNKDSNDDTWYQSPDGWKVLPAGKKKDPNFRSATKEITGPRPCIKKSEVPLSDPQRIGDNAAPDQVDEKQDEKFKDIDALGPYGYQYWLVANQRAGHPDPSPAFNTSNTNKGLRLPHRPQSPIHVTRVAREQQQTPPLQSPPRSPRVHPSQLDRNATPGPGFYHSSPRSPRVHPCALDPNRVHPCQLDTTPGLGFYHSSPLPNQAYAPEVRMWSPPVSPHNSSRAPLTPPALNEPAPQYFGSRKKNIKEKANNRRGSANTYQCDACGNKDYEVNNLIKSLRALAANTKGAATTIDDKLHHELEEINLNEFKCTICKQKECQCRRPARRRR